MNRTKVSEHAKTRIRLSVESAAMEFAVDRRALDRALTESGAIQGEDKCFSILDYHKAAAGGDLEAEKIRETRHKANLLEMEERERKGELMPMNEVRAVCEKVFVSIRAGILASHLLADEKDELLKTLQGIAGDAWKLSNEPSA